MIPNAEKIVSDYLREHPTLAGTRVVAHPPTDKDSAGWIMVTQLDDASVGGHRSSHLTEFYLQVDCYPSKDGGLPEARDLARTAQAALQAMVNYPAEDAVVIGADASVGIRRPDTDFEPARDRFASTLRVWMRPSA